jgi:RNase adapter protein RapZ
VVTVTDEVPAGEILIVTGMSGAGRTTAANALEDLGWYVVDNLPPQMLRPLLELSELAGNALPRVAAVVDVRGGELFAALPDITRALRHGRALRILFLDAADEVLVRRFESVRRPHPLQGDGTLVDGIRRERERLAPIRESADVIVDTSRDNIHQLATYIADLFADDGAARHTVTVMSFGFKYGLPPDADYVMDARFLPNPFWVPDLREHTGLEEAVSSYVLGQEGAGDFVATYASLIAATAPGFEREGKRYLTVAVGCTGGKHRSVAIAEELTTRLRDIRLSAHSSHRDLGRE